MLPLQIQSAFSQNILSLLLAAALTSGLFVVALALCSFCPALSTARPFQRLVRVLMVGLVAIQVFMWNLCFSGESRSQIDMVTFAFSFGGALLAVSIIKQATRSSVHRRIDTSLAAINAIGFCVCLQMFAVPATIGNLPIDPPGLLIPCRHAAYTDKGNKVRLYRRDLEDGEFQEFIRLSRPQMLEFAKHAMLRVAPLSSTNCHGWVFSAGRFIVRNEDVDLILGDNQYRQVSAPELEDVVVYRNDAGKTIHTGKVCGYLNKNVVLVESKWGIDATYVHAVDQQPYSQRFEFWRSDRKNHELSYELDTPSTASNNFGDLDD